MRILGNFSESINGTVYCALPLLISSILLSMELAISTSSSGKSRNIAATMGVKMQEPPSIM